MGRVDFIFFFFRSTGSYLFLLKVSGKIPTDFIRNNVTNSVCFKPEVLQMF